MPEFQFPELRLDASESAFLSRQLEHVRGKSYDIQFPELKGRRLVPVDGSVDEGAETVRYSQYKPTGKAVISKNQGEDAPVADLVSGEFTHDVFGSSIKYFYTLQEIRAARLAGLPLDARKAMAARRATEQLFDEIAFNGHAETGLLGILNQSNTVTYTPKVGAEGSKKFADKNAIEMLIDLFAFESSIIDGSDEVESPDTMILPLSLQEKVKTTRIGDGDSTTVLQHFLKNSLSVKSVEFSKKLETAGSGGSVTRSVCYKRSEDKLQLIIPKEFTQLAPQARGYLITTFCEARIGGVELYYPKSMAYADDF
jgi:hypothetical protein